MSMPPEEKRTKYPVYKRVAKGRIMAAPACPEGICLIAVDTFRKGDFFIAIGDEAVKVEADDAS